MAEEDARALAHAQARAATAAANGIHIIVPKLLSSEVKKLRASATASGAPFATSSVAAAALAGARAAADGQA